MREAEPDVVVARAPQRSASQLWAKRAVQAAFQYLVAPRIATQRINSLLVGKDRAFLLASESISRVPGNRGIYLRQAFYRACLASCGQDVSFGWLSTFSMPAVTIGEGVYIGRRCSIGYADIGSQTMLADGVQVLSGGREHGISDSDDQSHQDLPQTFTKVRIGAGAWLGTNAIIMADVGDRAVVGAGAVVTQPIPADAIAVGVPARVVKAGSR